MQATTSYYPQVFRMYKKKPITGKLIDVKLKTGSSTTYSSTNSNFGSGGCQWGCSFNAIDLLVLIVERQKLLFILDTSL
jgi:hypothetical protein